MTLETALLYIGFLLYFRVALGMLIKAWRDPDLRTMPKLAVVAMYTTCVLWPVLVAVIFLGWLFRPWRRT